MTYAPETLREAVQQVAESPKIAATVSTATTAIGAAAASDLIHGMLVNFSMIAGIIVTALLGCVHLAKYRILRRQLKDLEEGKAVDISGI